MRDLLPAIRSAYDRRASWFDGFVRWASLGRDSIYRSAAVEALQLRPGGRVLDLGCGTGLDFPFLLDAVGPDGRIVGVDLSRAMLQRARERGTGPTGRIGPVLVRADGGRLRFRTASFDAVLATYSLTTIPGWPRALQRLLDALRPGGRIAILDDRLPPGWFVGPVFMLRMTAQEGWRSRVPAIVSLVEKSCEDVRITNFHGGLIYLVTARRGI